MTKGSNKSQKWLSREMLADGTVQRLAQTRDGAKSTVLSEDELKHSRRNILPDDYHGPDIWVFGYGSLIWNPLIQFEERQDARVFGYHKRFCLWTRIGRGSPECPGLVLALDRGGSVRGHAFRVKAENAPAELDILWKREMLNNSYAPCWMQCKCEKQGNVKALGFVIRRELPSYAGRLTDDAAAQAIAQAVGFVGPCDEYLFETERALAQAGIEDGYITGLARRVRKLNNASD